MSETKMNRTIRVIPEQTSGIPSTQNRVTISTLQKMKREGKVVAALSIYDADHARIFDEAGGDLIIVGDSASMAVMGRPNTLPMTMEEMLFVTRSVCRGTKRLFVVADMPLGSYEVSDELAIINALRFMKEVGDRTPQAVKIEITMSYIPTVRAIARVCLVIAHIGLNPNKAEMLGGYRTIGKDFGGAKELVETAIAAEEAGACAILVESAPEELTQTIREVCGISVLGIAAGRGLDGQLLISSDILDLYRWPGNVKPRHFKVYNVPDAGMTVGDATLASFSAYVKEVKAGVFPSKENAHFLSEKNRDEVMAYLRSLKQGSGISSQWGEQDSRI